MVALAGAAIAVAAVVVAGAQYLIAHNRLRLDLFDKRWEVYLAVREFAAKALTTGEMPQDIGAFHSAVLSSEFLFDELVKTFLKDLHRNIFDKDWRARQLAHARNQEQRERLADGEMKAFQAIDEAYRGIAAKFDPFLSFSHVRKDRIWLW